MARPVERLGRFVMVRDVEGTLYAVVLRAVLVAVATEDGSTIVVLAGGRAVRLAEDLHTVASWSAARSAQEAAQIRVLTLTRYCGDRSGGSERASSGIARTLTRSRPPRHRICGGCS